MNFPTKFQPIIMFCLKKKVECNFHENRIQRLDVGVLTAILRLSRQIKNSQLIHDA